MQSVRRQKRPDHAAGVSTQRDSPGTNSKPVVESGGEPTLNSKPTHTASHGHIRPTRAPPRARLGSDPTPAAVLPAPGFLSPTSERFPPPPPPPPRPLSTSSSERFFPPPPPPARRCGAAPRFPCAAGPRVSLRLASPAARFLGARVVRRACSDCSRRPARAPARRAAASAPDAVRPVADPGTGAAHRPLLVSPCVFPHSRRRSPVPNAGLAFLSDCGAAQRSDPGFWMNAADSLQGTRIILVLNRAGEHLLCASCPGCHCRFHDHGDEAAEQRVYNGAYTDELCKKRRDMDDRIDPAATTILTLLEATARRQTTSRESNLCSC
ncbi:pistil-specific extensin-like protein [Panicum virgatum]|uniref:pistil-specific extensin-like protein n=1 Tax=Panicum virgatum TaxID=38727 RepID=UPI0019D4F625|nr:pistil-specific extensin-like protein [Panicum virgatum]